MLIIIILAGKVNFDLWKIICLSPIPDFPDFGLIVENNLPVPDFGLIG